MVENPFDIPFKLENLERRKAIQSAFDTVREIPFSIGQAFTPLKSLTQTLQILAERQKGSCSSKHYLLGSFFEKIGLKVAYMDYPFYWQNQNIFFPKNIIAIAKLLPLQYHTALMINGRYLKQPKIVDATWDPDLGKIGLTVNKIDLLTQDCSLAVSTVGEPSVFNSIDEIFEMRRKRKVAQPSAEIVRKFYKEFDEWLEKLRTTF